MKELAQWALTDSRAVADGLQTDMDSGLNTIEAGRRLTETGPNRLEEKRGRSIWEMAVVQIKEFLVLLLIGAAIVSFLLGEVEDAVTILVIVILNTVLGVVQEKRAQNSLKALREMGAPNAKVVRGGQGMTIPAADLVPGDLVLLEAGDRVPADLRLTETANLRIDESAFTGESIPADKSHPVLKDKPEGHSTLSNLAFMSTVVTYGRGKGLVVNTGMRTEIGRIATMLHDAVEEKTPLQKRLEELGKWLGGAAVLLVVVVFLTGLLRQEPLIEMMLTSISLAVAAIPEGLPAVVTIVLALGVQRMSKRRAIIRNLPAVETLGTATAICSDKTGTLTENQMTAVQVWLPAAFYQVSGLGYAPEGTISPADTKSCDSDLHRVLQAAVLANDARLEQKGSHWGIVGDPTEGALLTLAGKAGITRESAEGEAPRVDEIPFDSARKRMTTVHRMPDGRTVSFTKGAPDQIFPLCSQSLKDGELVPLTVQDRDSMVEVNREMASSALRVLAFACRDWQDNPADQLPSDEEVESELTFLGLVGMKDPARPEARNAVHKCLTAGIRPVMITGDNPWTARAIAAEVGIWQENSRLLTGSDLDELTDEQLRSEAELVPVYARVSPEHKVRIVDAMRARGHVVAMTGDGVNDAPALKRADIGAAMGITGTDVAKDAADMILVDDNFATIVEAVSEGRTIYANIRKSAYYLLSCNISEIAAIFTAIALGLGLPLNPLQILWVNLVTDGPPALALGLEPPEEGVMNCPPRKPGESIFAGGLGVRMLIQGVFIGFLALASYWLTRRAGASMAQAQTATLVTISLSQLLQAFNARSLVWSVFSPNLAANRSLWAGVGISLLLLLVVVWFPPLSRIFETEVLPLSGWLRSVGLASLTLVWGEVTKVLHRVREH